MTSSNTIERIRFDELTRERFKQDYQKPGRPFIVTDFLPATAEDWDVDFMQRHLGDEAYMVREYGEGYFDKPRHSLTKYCDHLKMPFGEFATLLESGEAKRRNLYFAQNPIGHTAAGQALEPSFRRWRETAGVQPIIPEATVNLWVGPSGHTEPLHFDPGDSTLLQLHGSKRVVLFAPEQTPDLYPFGFYDTLPFWVAQVEVDKPDFNAFPRLEKALPKRYEAVLQTGEMLYIPTHWWHEVSAVGGGYVSSVNFFWKIEPFLRNFNSSRSIILYVMNRLPWKWVMKFNRFVYNLKKPEA